MLNRQTGRSYWTWWTYLLVKCVFSPLYIIWIGLSYCSNVPVISQNFEVSHKSETRPFSCLEFIIFKAFCKIFIPRVFWFNYINWIKVNSKISASENFTSQPAFSRTGIPGFLMPTRVRTHQEKKKMIWPIWYDWFRKCLLISRD